MNLLQIKKDIAVMAFDKDALTRLANSLPELIVRYETLLAMQEQPDAPEEVPQPEEVTKEAVEALEELKGIVEEEEAEE